MWEYYCEKCQQLIANAEVELREDGWPGEWEEFHIGCDTKLLVGLKP